MNKGTKLRFIGVDSPKKSCRWNGVGLITGEIYRVKAGLGDGVPRNDGKVGAFIKDPNTLWFLTVMETIESNLCYQVSGKLWKK